MGYDNRGKNSLVAAGEAGRLDFSINGVVKTCHTWAGLLGARAGEAGVCSSWPFVTEASEVLYLGLGLAQGQRHQLQAWRSRITLSGLQKGSRLPWEG